MKKIIVCLLAALVSGGISLAQTGSSSAVTGGSGLGTAPGTPGAGTGLGNAPGTPGAGTGLGTAPGTPGAGSGLGAAPGTPGSGTGLGGSTAIPGEPHGISGTADLAGSNGLGAARGTNTAVELEPGSTEALGGTSTRGEPAAGGVFGTSGSSAIGTGQPSGSSIANPNPPSAGGAFGTSGSGATSTGRGSGPGQTGTTAPWSTNRAGVRPSPF